MNYFAHGRHFIDDPYFLAGTAVPDWLNVVDRRVRVRTKQARPHCGADDPRMASVAAGIIQHHRDDDWFHGTRAFAQLSLELCRRLRDELPPDEGFRPHFLGHILVEILLDAALIAEAPDRLQDYYAAVKRLDPACIESAINRMSVRPVRDLGWFIELFSRERFLWDYLDDGKLLVRLNQVMRRVGLAQLPAGLADLLGQARQLVTASKAELLTESA